MQIFVKNHTAHKSMTFDIEPTITVEQLKGEITNKSCVKPCQQRLIFAGKELQDNKTMNYYNIQKESTIIMIGRQLGGFVCDKKSNLIIL